MRKPSTFAWLVGFLLLWLEISALPQKAVVPELDPSWEGALVYFAAQQFQFGKDVIFTYGPLGYVLSTVYIGAPIPAAQIALSLGAKLLAVALVAAAMFQLPGRWRTPFLVYLLLFIFAADSTDAVVNLVIVSGAALLFHRGSMSPALNLVAAFFAVLGLLKFNHLLLASAAVVALACFYIARHAVPAAAIVLGSFLAGLVISWRFAGQALANLPAYLLYSAEIATGYKETMMLNPERDVILKLAVLAVVLAIGMCVRLYLKAPDRTRACLCMFFLAVIYLTWTRAVIRADNHVSELFDALPLFTLLLTRGAIEPRVSQRPRKSDAAIALLFAICILGLFAQRATNVTGAISNLLQRCATTTRQLIRIGSLNNELQQKFEATKRTFLLPRVQAEVGRDTIDVFGDLLGIGLLNGFNYYPRPAFQTYTAYTPALIDANAAFYASPRAPTYVLSAIGAIDGRLPASADSGALLQLLFRYQPLFQEGGYVLWKRTERSEPLIHREILNTTLAPGAEQPLPTAEPLLLELKFERTLLARAINLIYKVPPPMIHIRDAQGNEQAFRLPPLLASKAFLINPLIEQNEAAVDLVRDGKSRTVTSFSIEISRRMRPYYRPRIGCRVIALPNLVRTSAAAESAAER